MTGVVRLPPGAPPPAGAATLRVRLLDVSFQDAEAEVVAEQVIRGAALAGLADGIRFELHAGAIDPAATYAVEAHVETREDGLIHPGDYLTDQSYPVLTHGAPGEVDVEVRPV